MSTASKRTKASETKENNEWINRGLRTDALTKAIGLMRTGEYDPKSIVKDAQVFFNFLKGNSTK